MTDWKTKNYKPDTCHADMKVKKMQWIVLYKTSGFGLSN